MLTEGDPCPDFSLEDGSGVRHSLAEFKGRKLVIYVYPKDSTPGCTTEACEFRDWNAEFAKRGAAVVGLSADKPASHAKFAAKYGLPFLLLSDPDKTLLDALGVWGEKKLYGRVFLGARRSTFLVDEKGKIARVWPTVSPAGHAQAVLEALGGS